MTAPFDATSNEIRMIAASAFGSMLGIAIGLLLCGFAWAASRRNRTEAGQTSIAYPLPDWQGFVRRAAALLAFLVILHWIPDLATWLHGASQNRPLLINERSYRAVVFVGHAMATTGITTELIGALWAKWRNSRTTA